MGEYRYDALEEDEYDTLSHTSLGSPRYSTGHVGLDRGLRNEDGQTAPVVASSAGALEVETAIPTTNIRGRAGIPRPSKPSKEVIEWKDLPRKDQLLVLTLARLSEPLTQTSLQVREVFVNKCSTVSFGCRVTDASCRRICSISCDGVSNTDARSTYTRHTYMKNIAKYCG
jgi:hypothetical protein